MKELIYFHEKSLAPIGGPAGYLFNLKNEIDLHNDNSIDFINIKNEHHSFFYISKSKLNRGINRITTSESRIRYLKHMLWRSRVKSPIDFSSYDIIHFHGTIDMYTEKKQLENYKGIVVLTTHSPKVFFKENIEDYMNPDIYSKYKLFCDKLEEVDKYAFNRADVLVFPCEGAEEPYYKSWDKYITYRNNKDVRYIPTGIIEQNFKKSSDEIRKELNIPQSAYVISFVGRHNEVKGYDRLFELFELLDDVYFLCCGKENIKLSHPKTNRWIEIGWTDDPYSYVNASDLFILPNRETYFDLSLLQAISIGKTALISNTGGNKFFKNREQEGVYLFSDIEDAANKIRYLRDRENTEEEKSRMKEYFNNEFSSNIFYSRYKKLMKDILRTYKNE